MVSIFFHSPGIICNVLKSLRSSRGIPDIVNFLSAFDCVSTRRTSLKTKINSVSIFFPSGDRYGNCSELVSTSETTYAMLSFPIRCLILNATSSGCHVSTCADGLESKHYPPPSATVSFQLSYSSWNSLPVCLHDLCFFVRGCLPWTHHSHAKHKNEPRNEQIRHSSWVNRQSTSQAVHCNWWLYACIFFGTSDGTFRHVLIDNVTQLLPASWCNSHIEIHDKNRLELPVAVHEMPRNT